MRSAAHIVFIPSVHRCSGRPNSTQLFYPSPIHSYHRLSVSAPFCIYTPTHLLGLRIRPHLTSQRPHLLPRHASYSAPLLPFSSRFTSSLFLASALPSLLLLFFCLSQCLGKRNPSDCHTAIALSRSGHTLSASTGFLGVCCCAPHWLGDRQRINATTRLEPQLCFFLSLTNYYCL